MRRTYAMVLGAALVAAGCGGDDDDAASGKALTKAEYIAQADAICTAGKARSKTYSDQLDTLPADAQVRDTVPLLQGSLAATHQYVARVRGLAVPAQDKAILDEYFAAFDEAFTAADRLVAAAKTNNLETFKRVSAQNPELKASRKRIATRYGFKHCA